LSQRAPEKSVFKEQADVLAKTALADMNQENFVKLGIGYYKTTEDYKSISEGNKLFAEGSTKNDLIKHYKNVLAAKKSLEKKPPKPTKKAVKKKVPKKPVTKKPPAKKFTPKPPTKAK